MMKNAILMTTHANENQVKRLIDHLSKDFDIYVHIDKRSSIKIEKSERVFVYKEYKSYHGSFNQIMTTLFLLKEAEKNDYDRYIFISGQDLPLLDNKGIIDFFETNKGYDFIDIRKIPDEKNWPSMNRMTKFHSNRNYDNKNKILKNLLHSKYFMLKIIYTLYSKINPRPLEYDFYGGSNWFNLTRNCVNQILNYLETDKKYIKRYKYTSCADEIFFQTIINKLDGIEIINDALRYVDWASGPEFPRILRGNDYEKLAASKMLFARKFNSEIDSEIIDKIYSRIQKENSIEGNA